MVEINPTPIPIPSPTRKENRCRIECGMTNYVIANITVLLPSGEGVRSTDEGSDINVEA